MQKGIWMYRPKRSLLEGHAREDKPLTDIKPQNSWLKKYMLSNGMKVLLIESHKSPVISVQAWVETGSVDEQKGQEGITHFIEHLLFKQTHKFQVGEIASLVEGSGGQLNAYTSFDRTVFYVTIASQFSLIALDVLSEMILRPRFDLKDIDDERQVVIEEIKRSKDSPHSQSSDLLFSTFYPKHPYGHPILGYEHNIQTMTARQIVDYYRRHYIPKNITLVVSGDFDPQNLKPSIAKYFDLSNKDQKNTFQQKVKHPLNHVKSSLLATPSLNLQKTSFQETHLHLAWKLPPLNHPDLPALEVLSVILGQGHSSRLHQVLRLQNFYVHVVSCYTYLLKDGGIFTISCQLPINTINQALDELLHQLLLLFMEHPTLRELQKAITIIESQEYYEMETVDGLSEKYGFYESLFGDPNYVETYLKQIHRLSIQDLVRVTKTYLRPEDLCFCAMTNKKNGRQLEVKLREWIKHYTLGCDIFQLAPSRQRKTLAQQKSLETSTPNKKTTPSLPTALAKKKHIQKHKVDEVIFPSGARLYLYKSNQTPTVSLDLGFSQAGLVVEPQKLLGLCELMRRSWMGGTSAHTEESLKHQLDQLASTVQAFSGKNTMGLSLTTLSASFRKTWALFVDILKNPLFLENILEREKTALRKKAEKRKDNPFEMVSRIFMQTLFKGHPYARDRLGTDPSLDLITQEDVFFYWRKIFQVQNIVICAVGDFESGWIQDQIGLMLDDLPFKRIALKRPDLCLEPLQKSQKVFQVSDKAQSSIILGYRGLDIKSKNRFALLVLEAILSGQGGRLFLELRDKASLGYTVAPLLLTGKDAGFFAIYIACSPEKVEKAIRMIRVEMQRLCQEQVLEDELARAKQYLMGRYYIALQKNAHLSSAIFFREIYGISHKEVFEYRERVQSVTARQILNLSQQIFTQPEVLAIYGPSKSK